MAAHAASISATARRAARRRQGLHRHHLLAARDPRRVELRTMCRVREITVDEHGMASGAIYYDAEAMSSSAAEVVILAATASARRG